MPDAVVVISLAGVVAVALYFVAARALLTLLRGASVAPGSVADAERSLSPAQTRILIAGRVDDRCLAAALLSLVSKGHVALTLEEDRFVLAREAVGTGALVSEERAVLASLFAQSDPMKLGEESDPIAMDARHALGHALAPIRRRYLYENVFAWRIGVLAAVAMGFAAVLRLYEGQLKEALFFGGLLGTGALVAAVVIAAFVAKAFSACRHFARTGRRAGVAIGMVAFALGWIGLLVGLVCAVAGGPGRALFFGMVGLAVLCRWSRARMWTRTNEGKQILRQFLSQRAAVLRRARATGSLGDLAQVLALGAGDCNDLPVIREAPDARTGRFVAVIEMASTPPMTEVIQGSTG